MFLPVKTLRGQFIFEYVGEVLTQRQFEERAELYAEQGQPHFYFMTLQNDQIIDATRKGNLARFMNHSCNPNCATQKWIVRGRLRIGLFALKRIKAGSELTFDYKFIRFGGEAQRCLCGEANCKGVIGEEQSVVPAHGLTLSSSPQGRGRASKRRPQSTAQEEEDVEAAHKRFTEATGLNNEEDLTLLARILLRTEERDAIIDLLRILKKTTSDELLMRRFVTLHGLQIISVLMGLHWRDAEMIGLCVAILDGLPIANKNFVEDAHVEEKLERLINGRDDLDASTKQQIERILERWRGLRKVFRIPRASEASKGGGTSDGQEVPTSATPSNAPPTAAGYSLREGDFLLISRGGSSSWPNFTGTSIETEIPNRHRGLAVEDRRRPAAFANHQEEDIGRRSPQSSFLAGRSSIPGRHHSDRRRRSRSPPRRDASPTTKMPPGWHQAYDSNRRPYYYHEVTRETRWEPPLSAVTAKPVGRDEGKKLDEIIERARKAALSRDPPRDAEKEPSRPSTMSPVSSTHAPAHSSPPLPELEARFRDAVGSCVEKYLSRWCRSQIEPGSSRFKELCRKLTHGIVGKEFRQLRERMTGVDAHEHGREMISWIECDSKELPAGKRAKVKVFLLQYLKDHGYRIEE